MFEIPDAPWIREAEATGYSRYGYWNSPPDEDDDVEMDVGDFYEVEDDETD